MIKTQVQLPKKLYNEAKRIAREREMSLAEVMRRGLEYMSRVYPPLLKVQDSTVFGTQFLKAMRLRVEK